MNKKTGGFKLGLILATVFLVGRLITLQVIEVDHYRVLADENRVKLEVIKADRGVFYDRHGEILVRNTLEGREYVDRKALSSVLGYVGEISEEELDRCQAGDECQFGLGDGIGKMGLEKYYDEKLRGRDGGVLVETDADGEVLREVGRREPETGESLNLTLDLGLQKTAFKLMDNRKGGLVASDPVTGEVLAMVSSPGFDPEKIEKYLDDKDLPLFNRVVGGEYPPGSTFKIVTATAALEEGKVNEATKIEDTGEIKVGAFRYGNWYFDKYGQKEGEINLVRAIARSNDIFFYKLGEWLGALSLSDWAKYFGLGSQTKIDFPGEANGLMPDPDWKKEYIGEDWYLGDTYISAIGQGNVLMTPLQVNQVTSVMASKGKWCRPHILEIEESKCRSLDISSSSLEIVTEGLKQVTETGGTAYPFFNFEVKGKRIYVAGKTGTAEFGDVDSQKTHAWFTVFAPIDEPQIVVTVLLEGAGEGSEEAAPVVKDLLSYWFSRQ